MCRWSVKKSLARITLLIAGCLVALTGCETTDTSETGLAASRAQWSRLPENHRLTWKGHHIGMDLLPSQWTFEDSDRYDPSSSERLQLIFISDKESGTRLELYGSRLGAASGIGMKNIDEMLQKELKDNDYKLIQKSTRTIGEIPWHYYLTEEKFNNRKVYNVIFETFYRGIFLEGIIWTYANEGSWENVKNLADSAFDGIHINRNGETYWSPNVEVVGSIDSTCFDVRYGNGTLPFHPVDTAPGDGSYFDKLILLGEHQGFLRSIPLIGDHRDLRWNALIDAFSPMSGFSSQDVPERNRTQIRDFPYPAIKVSFPAAQAKGTAAWIVKAPTTAFLFLFIPIDEQPTDGSEFDRFIHTIQWMDKSETKEMDAYPDWVKHAHGTMYAYLSAHQLNLGNLLKAESWARQALSWNPNSAEVVMALANILLQSGKYAECLPFLEEFAKENPDNLQVKRLLGLSYYLSGETNQGRAAYQEILSSGPVFDLWIREHFYQLHQAGMHEEILEDVEDYKSNIGGAYDLWTGVALAAESKVEEGVSFLDKYLEKNPGDAEAHLIKVQVLLENGENAIAQKAAEVGFLETNNVDLLYMEGVAYNALGVYSEAKKVFQECLRINPSHASAQQLLSLVNSMMGETDYSLFDKPIEAVEMPDRIRKEAESFDLSMYDGYGAVAEWMGVAVSYIPDVSYRKTYYKKFHILDETGIPELKETTYDFNPLYHRLYVNRLEVYDAAGNKVGEGVPSQYYTSDRGGDSIINSEKTLHIPIPNLQAGGSFEIVWSVEILGNIDSAPFESYTFGGLFPRHVCFASTMGELENYQFTTGIHEVEQLNLEDGTVWISRDTDAYEMKHFLPIYSSYMPTIWFTSANGNSWPELAKEYADQISEYLQPNDELQKLALSLSSPEDSEEARLKAVAGYIGSNYNYKALAFGTRATIPNKPEVILNNKFGDCKDLSVLSYHLFRALGLEANLVLVDTKRDLVKEVKTIDQFDHMVVILDLHSGSLLYDPSDKYMPILQVPRTVPRASVLRITGSSEEIWFEGSDPLPGNNRVEINRHIEVNEESFFLVSEEAVFTGVFAATIRQGYSSYQNQDRVFAMQSLLAGNGIRINIVSVDIENLEELQEPLRISYSYNVRNPLHNRTGRKQLNLEGTWETNFLPLLGSDPDRTQEVYVHMPFSVNINTRIHLPEGMEVNPNSVEEEYRIENDLGLIQRMWEIKGNRVDIDYKALIQSGKFPASSYSEIFDLSEAVQETSRFSFEVSE